MNVRGFVRNVTKARERLALVDYDTSGSTFVGGVTDPNTFIAPMDGAHSLINATRAPLVSLHVTDLRRPSIPVVISHRCSFQRGYDPAVCSRGSGHHVVEAHVRHFQALWLDHGCEYSVRIYCLTRRQDDCDGKLHLMGRRRTFVCGGSFAHKLALWRVLRGWYAHIRLQQGARRSAIRRRLVLFNLKPSSETCFSLNSK